VLLGRGHVEFTAGVSATTESAAETSENGKIVIGLRSAAMRRLGGIPPRMTNFGIK
jgi:hypothetical protein